ncbi:MAG: hypothetical protein AzoDbin1_04995, partial [Azoarcus sp.]|nr:hypothetical protein [Azoarcus sp.]
MSDKLHSAAIPSSGGVARWLPWALLVVLA